MTSALEKCVGMNGMILDECIELRKEIVGDYLAAWRSFVQDQVRTGPSVSADNTDYSKIVPYAVRIFKESVTGKPRYVASNNNGNENSDSLGLLMGSSVSIALNPLSAIEVAGAARHLEGLLAGTQYTVKIPNN